MRTPENAIRSICITLIGFLLLVGCSQRSTCANVSGVQVCNPILEYTRERGGTGVFGNPITAELEQNDYRVQFFEKAIIRYPVASANAKAVELRPLGIELSTPTAPENPQTDPECQFFPLYGHHVCFAFYDFYIQHGGINTFGAPISHVMVENGTRVQYFENVKFKWIEGINSPHVELEEWGTLICLQEEQTCASQEFVTRESEPTPTDEVVDGMAQYVKANGGEAVFGNRVGSLVHAGNVIYQYYENACLLWTPGASNPISLAPLGLIDAPTVPRIAPIQDSDQVLFFPETGHSIVMAFLDFYVEHGGREVLGLPLTEFIEESDLAYQWFENARLEWRPDLPNGQRVQLAPLGEINYRRLNGGLPDIQGPFSNEATALPPEIALQVLPEYPLLTLGQAQRVTLLAYDPVGRLLPNIIITLYVDTNAMERVIVAEPTNSEGRSVVDLGMVEGECGEMVQLRAVAEASNSIPLAHGQFTLWCAPEP